MTNDRIIMKSLAALGLIISVVPNSPASASGDPQATVASRLAAMQSAIRNGTLRFEQPSAQTLGKSPGVKLAGDCPNGYGRMYGDGKCHKGFAQ